MVILFSLFLYMFFDAAQIGYKYVSVVIIPQIWTVWVTACVYQGKLLAAAGLEPDTPVPWVSQWAWRHNIPIICIVNINQSPILYRLCRSLIKWISGDIYRPMPSKLMRCWTNLQRWFTVGPALQTVNHRWATSHNCWDRAHASSPNRRVFFYLHIKPIEFNIYK